ncbi:hypothetical protein Ahy_B03g068745 isoform C [Arachis hypogaea]|uniref:Uncharacterized protein n=1 Tax=Arachis hypogaea TaxID=3818 RepID=A0A445AAP9_ARAHY|nr:hypothetical protein Ahy_B03g068745 isoform C [Arachis hypogaea]
MQTLKFHYAVFSRLSSYPRSFLSLFSTNSASQPSQCSKQRTFVLGYVNSSFKFSKSQSIYISKHVSQVRSQLLMLLNRQPRLSAAPEASLRNHVPRAVSIGFHKNSRMFVHALHTDRLVPRKSFAALDINEAIDIAYILRMSKELFDRYILRFRGNVETLLVAYKGHYLQV